MTWLEMYGQDTEPTEAQMEAYVSNPLWAALHAYLQEAYQAQPKRSFSGCSGQPGWNVKYQKRVNRFARFTRWKVILLRWWL